MHFDLEQLVRERRIVVKDVLHVGAHHGQKAETYMRLGATNVTWVEANPAVVPVLRAHVEPFGHRVLTTLVTDRSGDLVDFHITNNEQSSSVLKLGTHRYEHPDIVVTESMPLRTTTLDDLCESEAIDSPNLLVLDVQGAELLVLRGAERVLDGIDFICTEVNERPLYADAGLLPELDAFLGAHGFHRYDTTLTIHGYGDALYLKEGSGVPTSPEEPPAPVTTGHPLVTALRHRLGSRARQLVSGAVDPRFDAVEAELRQLTHRMAIIEQMLVRSEQEVAALRQEIDEYLNALRSRPR